MDKNLLRAQLLMEAADLLNESESAVKSREFISKKKEVEQKIKDFLTGKMEPSEARKIYNTISKDIDKLRQAAKEIPAPNPNDPDDVTAFKNDGRDIGAISMYTIGALAVAFGPMWGLLENGIGLGAMIVTEVLGVGAMVGGLIMSRHDSKNPDYGKDPSEAKFNFNKARALREIAKLESMIEKAYSKYYNF